MKTYYKNLFYTASGTILCLLLAGNANAQRTTSSGGSGGGGHASSGGSSVSSARPSGGGGGVSYSRPSSVGSPNISRPSAPASPRYNSAPQKATYVYRNGTYARNYTARQNVAVRGNYGYPQRTGYTVSNTAYRTAPKIGYARAGGYWGTHGYYHLNKGIYTTQYVNNIGYHCRYLPYGYYSFFYAELEYWYLDGLFYTYDNDQYTVVEPPVGAEVTSICDDAQSIVINGEQYYECTGVYYQKVTKDDGTTVYVVAGKDGVLNTGTDVQDDQPQGPQMGDIVTQLPPDCKKIKVNGQKLWVSPDGVYYQEQVDVKGLKTYKIVGLPTDEPDQN